MDFEQMMRLALGHAERAGVLLSRPDVTEFQVSQSAVHAQLAEAYARTASALVVNATSIRAMEPPATGRGN